LEKLSRARRNFQEEAVAMAECINQAQFFLDDDIHEDIRNMAGFAESYSS
jgi:hypothetical protein